MHDSARRSLILDAASRLLRHYGAGKTTVADIAREARLGVGTVYLEFRSKDSILGALASRRHEHVLEAIERAIAADGTIAMRLERALQARFEAFHGCSSEGTHAGDLFHCRLASVEEAHESYRSAEAALFTRLLEEGVRAGELAIDDPVADARALLRAYTCYAPPLVFQIEVEVLRADLPRLHRMVLAGLLTRSSG